ncbi:MAG: ATP synthase subunit I [Chthoniobacterales bacterium]
MSDLLVLLLVFLAGIALGAIFFGGLWWTVRNGLVSARPALWFFASFVLRTGIALAGIYFVAGGTWERLVACLLGFIIARLIVTWLTQTSTSPREINHAP